MNVVSKLPLVNVKWQMKRNVEGTSQGEPSKVSDAPSRDSHVYVQVEAEESCVLRVELTRTTLRGGRVGVRGEGLVWCVRREGLVWCVWREGLVWCVRKEGLVWRVRKEGLVWCVRREG